MTTTMTKAEQKVLDSRYIPDGYRLAQGITHTTQVYYKDISAGNWIVLIFLGRAVKPTKHVRFATEEGRQQYVDNMLNNYQKRQERVKEAKEKRKAAQAEGHGVKVGDIFVASWGYEQTNLNWYQVTKLVGKTMVEIREIADVVTSTPHFTYYEKAAIAGQFVEKSHLNNYQNNEPVRKRVSVNTWGDRKSVSINVFGFANAYPWDGKPKYETNSQFGH